MALSGETLVSPKRLTGPELNDVLTQYWSGMDRTRRNAEKSNTVIAGEDRFVMPSSFAIAGADQYIAAIPHPRTVPQRALQGVIKSRPHLGIPLGPKGLGITGQRLTTRVEQPLNAICEDERAGFQWETSCATILFEGWCAGITILDPADWLKHPSAWDDDKSRTWKRRYRVDEHGRSEDQENYSGKVDSSRARKLHQMDLDVHRARNVPIRHRAISIRNSAPIFGPDLSVEGLLISQEFSTSYLRRKYRFGEGGLTTPTGSNAQDGTGGTTSYSGDGTMTLIEAWLIDEDGLPYVSYCVKGRGGSAIEAKWKGGDYDGQIATIDLKSRFGLARLPVTWAWGLGNPAETNPDRRAMGFLEPFMQGWSSVRAKMTAINVATMFGGFPILIEESDGPGIAISGEGGIEDDEPNKPDLQPLKITSATPGTKLRVLEIQAVNPEVFKAIDLELGANESESPGKSNKDQSGFSQSMAEAFEERALTTVQKGLKALYEAHGSFTLEAGKRLPERGRDPDVKGSGYAPIMVFASTDVPPTDKPGADNHNEPMELDPDLIDETFNCVARYAASMSIPEEQQSMEAVARNLKTRRRHLEDKGDENPEQTEIELMLEAIRGTPEWQKYAMKLMSEAQGAEELEEIARAQAEGLADEDGLATGLELGVAPVPPPGAMQALQQGAPGVPVDGSVTGGAAPNYGQSALAGIAAGGSMAGPISVATQAGGIVPQNLPVPGSI